MASELTIAELRGEGQGQRVRIMIEVAGAERDFTEMGRLIRREMTAGLMVDVAKTAASFGVALTEVGPQFSPQN